MAEILRAEKLSKRFGAVRALDQLDLSVNAGEVFGYLGPNGAGKSVTIALILGLLRPSEGRVTVFGLDSWSDAKVLHRRLAYVPSETTLWPSLTGAETLKFLANLHGGVDRGYSDELIERFAIEPDKKIRNLSHGNRQKVALVAALATRADLLVLDDPTVGLDPIMEREFQRCVVEARHNGQTVFISSHILSEVEAICDRVAMLHQGRLVEIGSLEQLKELRALKVVIESSTEIPDLSSVEGVLEVSREFHQVVLEVSGSMAPLMRAIREAEIVSLRTYEPSLEELFFTHYSIGRSSAQKTVV